MPVSSMLNTTSGLCESVCAAEAARRRRLGLIETLPHARLLAGQQADAGVLDAEHDFGTVRVSLRRGADPDRPAFWGELDGVHQQIAKDLLQPLVVRPDGRQIVIRPACEHADTFVDADDAYPGGSAFDRANRVQRGVVELERARLEL